MQLRDRLAYVAKDAGRPAQPQRAVLLPGLSQAATRFGTVYYRDRFFPLDHRHGDVELQSVLNLDPVLLDRLGSDLSAFHVREAAFLDIETTGLSGGTGTYAFLVGIGTFDGFAFRVRQFFLAEPSGERAFLTGLLETLERCRSIVSFNGRTFDLPQLTTRFALARLPPPVPGLPHIDLLYPARRLYGRKLDSCRLSEIERRLLGLRRYGDIAGVLIPHLYFSYVRRGHARGLEQVFDHNCLDVLSLVAFLGHLNDVAGLGGLLDAAHHLNLGRWDEARGRLTDAMEQYRLAQRADAGSEEGSEAVRRLARLHRRRAEWHKCLDLWAEEVRAAYSLPRVVRAQIELAKLHEHIFRDPASALVAALVAASAIESAADPPAYAVTAPLLQRRVQRLRRRVE